MVAKPKVEYTTSTAQKDLEARLSDDSVPVYNESTNPAPVGEDGFVGVSPEYQNYANDTDAPLASEKGAEAEAEDAFDAAYGDSSGEPSDAIKEAYATVSPTSVAPDAPADASVESSTEDVPAPE